MRYNKGVYVQKALINGLKSKIRLIIGGKSMSSFNNVPQGELIAKTAEKLKSFKELTPPAWANYVKTGTQKQRPPMKDDWWYTRVAALLRTLALKGPIGVSKLRTKYGGRKRRGHQPPEFRKGSGSIIRKALQQLEKAGLAKQKEKDIHKGRIITTKGIKLLNDAAKELFKTYPKHVVKVTEEIVEADAAADDIDDITFEKHIEKHDKAQAKVQPKAEKKPKKEE